MLIINKRNRIKVTKIYHPMKSVKREYKNFSKPNKQNVNKALTNLNKITH